MSALRIAPDLVPDSESTTRGRPRLDLVHGQGGHRDRLAVVRAPLRARSAAPFALMCGALLAGALVCVLLLNTRLVHGSYELARLQRDSARAAQDVQMLHEQVRAAQANLPLRAAALGMEPAEQTIPLDVSSAVVFTAEEFAKEVSQ